jgi:hypothetical protein
LPVAGQTPHSRQFGTAKWRILPFRETWANLSKLSEKPPAPNHPNWMGQTVDKGLILPAADADGKVDESFENFPGDIVAPGNDQIRFPMCY